ncbi:uncharacterized protein LOC126428388 [Schistocerca serialis cubense]|uniref:uncharacterized protein LOC126428388 n=1 Tax=Schistocerca serialis cubense TaxID=2023355 RepID=UPI00214E99FA|nr:uncharacterized protein LOC126428388 [Schistocerca serialis cubense]
MASGAEAAEERPPGIRARRGRSPVEGSCRWLLRLIADCLRDEGAVEAAGADAAEGWGCTPLRILTRLWNRHHMEVEPSRLMAVLDTGVLSGVLERRDGRYRVAAIERQEWEPERPQQEEWRRGQRGRRGQRRRRGWQRAPCWRCGRRHRAGECTGAEPAAGQRPESPCAICLEAAGAAGGGRRAVLRCGHAFHHKCVGRWFRVQPTCPLCRRYAALW